MRKERKNENRRVRRTFAERQERNAKLANQEEVGAEKVEAGVEGLQLPFRGREA